MKPFVERILKTVRLYHPLRNGLWRLRSPGILADWQKNGRPVPPPPAAKHQTLRDLARRSGLRILVETGTYRGDTLQALRQEFDRLYSIELSPALFAEAQNRFRSARNIELIQGDSGSRLAQLVPRIEQPALFWLDGHYSAGITARGDKVTPVFDELEAILAAPLRHVVVIDDARLFGMDPGYPSLDELRVFVLARNPDLDITVQDDSIRIIPRPAP